MTDTAANISGQLILCLMLGFLIRYAAHSVTYFFSCRYWRIMSRRMRRKMGKWR